MDYFGTKDNFAYHQLPIHATTIIRTLDCSQGSIRERRRRLAQNSLVTASSCAAVKMRTYGVKSIFGSIGILSH